MDTLIGLICFGYFMFFISLLLYPFYNFLSKREQFSKLIKFKRTDITEFKDFNQKYKEIKSKFNLDYFEIAFLKDEKVVIKIKDNYFDVSDNDLVLNFNENTIISKLLEE